MNIRRAVGTVLALTLVLVTTGTGLILIDHRSGSPTGNPTLTTPQVEAAAPERTDPQDVQPSVTLPSRDVPGRDVPNLPRYPDSVRVEYRRTELESLVLTRVRYVSSEKLDAVRGFYRGVFRSKGWRVANAEFSEGTWTFLAVKGRREADIEVKPYGPGVETDIRLSAPRSVPQPDRRDARQVSPPRGEAPPQPAPSVTPPSSSPAPAFVPDDDYYEGDDEEYFEDGDD